MESRTQGSRPRTQKKIQDQGLSFRGQTLSKPKTGMLEAKDQGHMAQVFSKIKKGIQKFFSGDFQKNSTVLEPKRGQFSRTRGFEAKDLTFEAKDFKCVLEVKDVLENSTSDFQRMVLLVLEIYLFQPTNAKNFGSEQQWVTKYDFCSSAYLIIILLSPNSFRRHC